MPAGKFVPHIGGLSPIIYGLFLFKLPFDAGVMKTFARVSRKSFMSAHPWSSSLLVGMTFNCLHRVICLNKTVVVVDGGEEILTSWTNEEIDRLKQGRNCKLIRRTSDN